MRGVNSFWSSGATHTCTQVFFFFQAEDGIRDYKVTGVQTCALPISRQNVRELPAPRTAEASSSLRSTPSKEATSGCTANGKLYSTDARISPLNVNEIGRASCRKECRSRWSPYH